MFQKISHLLAVHNEEFKYGTTCFTVTQWGLRVKGADETNQPLVENYQSQEMGLSVPELNSLEKALLCTHV